MLHTILVHAIRKVLYQSVFTMKLLSKDFFDRSTVLVAQELLGKPFRCQVAGRPIFGQIVETEAYQSDDEACHAFKGKTKRNQALFGPVGHTYVYLIYGIHFCLNIVARTTEQLPAGGVLIRGICLKGPEGYVSRIDGPGRVAKALSITTEHISIDVTHAASPFIIGEDRPLNESQIIVTKRIGLSKGIDKPWRFLAC